MAATSMKRAGLALLTGAVLAGGWWVWLRQASAPVSLPVGGSAADWIRPEVGNGAAASDAVLPALRTGLEGLPRSLAGTEVDGGAQVDANGHLRPDRGLRNLFDYFLSLVGEEPLARVRARIVAYLQAHLPVAAAAEGVNLLDRYLAYQSQRGQLGRGSGGGAAQEVNQDTLAQRLAQLKSLRQAHFSVPEREAFFGDEEAYDQYTLQKMAVMQDASLSAVDKAQRLRQLVDALPAEMRESLTAVDRYEDLHAVAADWRAHGGSPEALRAARVQLVGEEATARLEALDLQRAQWAQRVQAYQAQKARLMSDASLSTQQRDQALQQLQASSFNEQERLRLAALDEAPGRP
jgi:lipase chaperone LimK